LHPTLRAVEEVADFDAEACLAAGIEPAHLELEDLAIGILEDRRLRVGRLLRADVAERIIPAGGLDFYGVPGFAEAPAGDVELVGSLVAEVAVAGVPVPVPHVVRLAFVVRLPRCGSEPEVVVQSWRRIGVGDLGERITRLEAEPARHVDLADDPVVKGLNGAANAVDRAVL